MTKPAVVYFSNGLKWSSSVGSRSMFVLAFLSLIHHLLVVFAFNRCLLRRQCCRAASSKFVTCFSGFVLRRGTRSWIPGSTSSSDVPYWNASRPRWTGPAAPSRASTLRSRRPSAGSRVPHWEERLTVWSTSGQIQTKPDKRIRPYLCRTSLRRLVPLSKPGLASSSTSVMIKRLMERSNVEPNVGHAQLFDPFLDALVS